MFFNALNIILPVATPIIFKSTILIVAENPVLTPEDQTYQHHILLPSCHPVKAANWPRKKWIRLVCRDTVKKPFVSTLVFGLFADALFSWSICCFDRMMTRKY